MDKAKDIRLVAFDLDGTLTNNQKRLTSATREALADLQARGIRVVLASGRPTYGILHLAQELDMAQHDGYILAYNGSKVVRCSDMQLVAETRFPRHLLPQLAQAARTLGAALVTYDDAHNLILATESNQWVDHESFLNNNMPTRIVDDIDAAAPAGLPKCMMTGEPDHMAEIVPELQKMFPELDICRSAPYFIEIVPRGIDKARKLDELAHMLGLAQQNVAAFGDGQNDLGMIRYAALGIAMDNAFDEVKAAADFVTLSNENDGVAHALRTLGLI